MDAPQENDSRSQSPTTSTSPGAPDSLQSSTHPRHTTTSAAAAPSDQISGAPPIGSVPLSPWSPSPDKQLGFQPAASDISSDRVFPIRSVITVDPATSKICSDDSYSGVPDGEIRPIPVHRPGTHRGDQWREFRRSSLGGSQERIPERGRRRNTARGPMSSIQLDAARHASSTPLQLDIAASDDDTEGSGLDGENTPRSGGGRGSASTASGTRSLSDVPLVATRFAHVVTEEGHAIITGRDGVLQRCEDEPIHAPGAIQGFGVLVAFREESDSCLSVRYASENSERMLGLSPRQLFKLKNFLDIMTDGQQDNLLDHIDFIRDEDADPAINGPEVFSLSIRPAKKRSRKLWCAIHINPTHPDLIICEFEFDHDEKHPLRPPDEMTPDSPLDTLQSNPTLEEIEESTEILSKPLRILRSARKRRGEQGAMQVFDIMSQVQEQLASAPNLEIFLKILVGIVKELTGFHRVMVYQFDSSFNGKVVTELVDTTKTRDLYKGLSFPASDIPRQARDLYKLNKVRLLFDRDLKTARIVCRSKEDLEVPLDMSHAYLRAMSPIHLKYLANMAVRSSMSISINAFDELWGLIACHSYGNQGMRVSFPIRKMCRLIGDAASRNIERLSYASRLQARKLINTKPTDQNPSGYIIASSDDLLRLFDADFGLLSIKGETKILGTIEQSQEALAMWEYLRMRRLTSVVASQDVAEDFPDLKYPPGFQVMAGLLYVPLSAGGNDFIVFFRKGQIKEVKWAGNPYEKIIREGTAEYLEPRTSFKTWHETILGKCRDWTEEQIETAAVLCLVYGKFIEVWRQKEAALQSSRLTRLLLANSAHEVRTPLNAIINYLEIALEGSLDQETRENLARSHSASKSLIYVINDLLDLTNTENGPRMVKGDAFELTTCLRDATEPFRVDAKRKGIDYTVIEHPGLPRYVHGDERRIRQAISNLTANAVAHTQSGFVKIEAFVAEVRDQRAVVEFIFADSGSGMTGTQLDALFRDLEQVSTEEGPRPSPQMSGKRHETRTLGLGLAVVARLVRNMDGQLRLKSAKDEGSRFVVQLPFLVPDESSCFAVEGRQAVSQTTQPFNPVASGPPSLKAVPGGEIMLVDRNSALSLSLDDHRVIGTRKSLEGYHGIESQSSHESDADRLIDAIQTPLYLNNDEPSYLSWSRRSSESSRRSPSVRSRSATARSISPIARRQSTGISPTRGRAEPGFAGILDTKTPIKAVKIADEFADMPSRRQPRVPSRVLFELSEEGPSSNRAGTESVASTGTGETPRDDFSSLQVLVAEDDPINMKILKKRLERTGHKVYHTVNGEDCATVYREQSVAFDVILMDMQMPIVDGLTSTMMIRALERSPEHLGHSTLANSNGRIPIFAVSASLIEHEKQKYIDAGFDGWILKPVDFKRLNTLLIGISEEEVRNSCLYTQGQWERGGWFCARFETNAKSTEDITPRAEDGRKAMGGVHSQPPAVDGVTDVHDCAPSDPTPGPS